MERESNDKTNNLEYNVLLKVPIFYLKNTVHKIKSKVKYPIDKNIKEMEKSTSFNIYFPNLFYFINKIENLFTESLKNINNLEKQTTETILNKLHDYFIEFISKNLSLIEQDFTGLLLIEWNRVKKAYHYTCIHTIIASILINNDANNHYNFNDTDKNIMLWTILMHDISKYVILNKNSKENFSKIQ